MDKGLALVDIISELYSFITAIEFPAVVKVNILIKLADIE